MKLYGAKVTEHYLELSKRKPINYPNSQEYPPSANYPNVPIMYQWKKQVDVGVVNSADSMK